MAISQGNLSHNQWSGLSTDAKPTDSRPALFDLFYETDTGKAFIFNGTTWVSWPPQQPVSQPGSEVNPASAVNGYKREYPITDDPRRLTAITAITVAAGVINQAGGVANDTLLTYVYIPANATAITLTVAGFKDETGAAISIVLTGSTTTDLEFHPYLKNSAGAMTLTASVASKVLVGVRPA